MRGDYLRQRNGAGGSSVTRAFIQNSISQEHRTHARQQVLIQHQPRARLVNGEMTLQRACSVERSYKDIRCNATIVVDYSHQNGRYEMADPFAVLVVVVHCAPASGNGFRALPWWWRRDEVANQHDQKRRVATGGQRHRRWRYQLSGSASSNERIAPGSRKTVRIVLLQSQYSASAALLVATAKPLVAGTAAISSIVE